MTTAVVVGGGAIGLSVAESLRLRGVQATVVEAERCGGGASAGNAGWVTPSLAIPVPGPGVIGQSIRWLVNPSGPLWIRPTLSPALLGWVARFTIGCRRTTYRHGLRALQAAAARAAASFDGLAERGVSFEHHDDDLVYPAFSAPELQHLVGVADELAQAGAAHPMQPLGADEIRAREPALSGTVIGGLVATGEQRVRPESFTDGLRAHLLAHGVEIVEQTPVTELSNDRAQWIVRTSRGEHRAEIVVLAAGTTTADLLKPHGFSLPLAAAKGYSRTFARVAGGPAGPLYLEKPKVAISVYDDGVRVSGTLELGAQSLSLSPRRLQAITGAARQALPNWEPPPNPTDWAGMRSLSPDGLPYIGAIPGLDGMFVATGHATLGITLAPLTGELIGSLIVDEATDPLLKAFDPTRTLRPTKPRAQGVRDEGRERSDRHPLRIGSDH